MQRPTRLILACLCCLAVALSPTMNVAQDKSKEDLQKEALALNNVRSAESVSRKLKELGEDKRHQKRLVQAALPLAQKEDQPFNYSAAHILGFCALQARENTAAITFLKIAIDKANKVKSEKNLLSNRLWLIRAYLADHKPVEAEKVAEKMVNFRPKGNEEDEQEAAAIALQNVFLGKNELVRCMMAQGKFDKAQENLKALEDMAEKAQLNARARAMIKETKASFLHYKGDVKEAIKVYEELMDEAETEDEKDGYREVIGNLHGDIGEIEKADGILSELLKKKPDNPGLNNDLGYLLSVHDRKLDQAEKMIRKAVEAEPENSSFLDSMAWVLYKKKQYKEAKVFMLKAVEQERGRNTELFEHLGDIHSALGEKQEAKVAYEKSVSAATPNYKDQQRKREVEKKVKKLAE